MNTLNSEVNDAPAMTPPDTALQLNPSTAEITVEESTSDTIPVIQPDSIPVVSADPPEHTAADASNLDTFRASLLGSDRDLKEVSPGLVVPADWIDEFATHPCSEFAARFIERLSPLGKQTPWLVTSMSKDLAGTPRTDSADHGAGKAMDVSPMYSDKIILPEAPPIMGLAWNIKSLLVLSEGQWGDIPIFVEGDHLHFSTEIECDDRGCLPIMWSDSDSYPNMANQQLDPILSRLRNSFWRWSTAGLRLEPPSSKLRQRIANILRKAGASESIS